MIGKSAAEFKRLVRPCHIIGSVVDASVRRPDDDSDWTDDENCWYDGDGFGWRLTDARRWAILDSD